LGWGGTNIASCGGDSAADLRARAMIPLCVIYALRNSEVIRLSLDDFDWHNETFMSAYQRVKAHEFDDHRYVDPMSTYLLAPERMKALESKGPELAHAITGGH
jgi:integrase